MRQLKSILSKFHKEIDYALKLVRRVEEIRRAYSPPRGSKLSSRDVELITELAFLKIFVAYEYFMEDSFLAYLSGMSSPKKYLPKRYLYPRNKTHAQQILLGDNPRYTDWSQPDKIKNRATYCFRNGDPYVIVLSTHQPILDDIKTIRNKITHSSPDSDDKFLKLARKYLTTLPLTRPLTVGAFLLMNNPKSSSPKIFIETFCDNLHTISKKIAP